MWFEPEQQRFLRRRLGASDMFRRSIASVIHVVLFLEIFSGATQLRRISV